MTVHRGAPPAVVETRLVPDGLLVAALAKWAGADLGGPPTRRRPERVHPHLAHEAQEFSS